MENLIENLSYNDKYVLLAKLKYKQLLNSKIHFLFLETCGFCHFFKNKIKENNLENYFNYINLSNLSSQTIINKKIDKLQFPLCFYIYDNKKILIYNINELITVLKNRVKIN